MQIAALIDDAVDASGSLIDENKIEVRLQISRNLPETMADAGAIRSAIQNLISNALKFRGNQPPVIHVGVERNVDQNKWLFSIKDNGIGIEQKCAERIFLIFQRLHSRNDYPGTGIGLALCKRIVERHGGRIWLKSEPGKGSTFYFTIPQKR